jgi:hypothetical protein
VNADVVWKLPEAPTLCTKGPLIELQDVSFAHDHGIGPLLEQVSLTV